MIGDVSYARVNGARIAYEVNGQGFPLLLLHGFPRTHRTWEKVTPALADRFTVAALDRRGYGDSDRPQDPATYDNANMTLDAIELTRHLGWEQFVVVGHDRGAPVARRLAMDYPEAVRGVMIVDGSPQELGSGRPDPTGRSWYFAFFRQRGVAEQLIGQDPRLFFSLFLDRNPHLTPEEHEYYVQMFCRRGTVDAILADYRAGLEIDPEYWAEQTRVGRKVRVPLYAIWGSRGPSANSPVLEQWRQVADDVRGGEAIADAGHYVHEEQPEAAVAHVMRFADGLGIP